MARLFKFVDMSGCVLHSINDPEDQLPIPANGQEVSIGPIRMWVISVMLSSISPQTYCVRVRTAEKDGAPERPARQSMALRRSANAHCENRPEDAEAGQAAVRPQRF